MDGKKELLPNLKAQRSIRKAVTKMMCDIEKEPQLILEIGDCPELKDPFGDIITWLFRRREHDETARD